MEYFGKLRVECICELLVRLYCMVYLLQFLRMNDIEGLNRSALFCSLILECFVFLSNKSEYIRSTSLVVLCVVFAKNFVDSPTTLTAEAFYSTAILRRAEFLSCLRTVPNNSRDVKVILWVPIYVRTSTREIIYYSWVHLVQYVPEGARAISALVSNHLSLLPPSTKTETSFPILA